MTAVQSDPHETNIALDPAITAKAYLDEIIALNRQMGYTMRVRPDNYARALRHTIRAFSKLQKLGKRR